MSELRDPRIAELLDRVVPATDELSTWDAVLADARGSGRRSSPRWRKRRALALVVAALLLLVVAPLSALAVTQGWWFFRSGLSPQPVSPVVVVARGSWNSVHWTLTAYRSGTDGVCFALTPGTGNGTGAAMDCDTITGVPIAANTKPSAPHAISYLMGTGPNGTHLPDYITGPVVDTARTVEIRFTDGTTVDVPTIVAPSALRSRIRFYATPLPARHSPVQSVVGLDGRGRVVARLAIPNLNRASAAYRMSNHGVRVHLPAGLQHLLRLQHRSTDVWLLATRDGKNIYRMGGRDISRGVAHTCFGVGNAIDPATLPATERGIGQLAGSIGCTAVGPATFPSPDEPVRDLSIYGANRGDKEITLLRLAGLASDEVKRIELLDDKHHILARVPVIDNVFSLRHVPKGVTFVVPVNADGQALAECGPNARAGIRGAGSYLRARC